MNGSPENTGPTMAESEPQPAERSASSMAREILDAVKDANSPYTDEQLRQVGISEDSMRGSAPDRVSIEGELEGEPVSQTLALSRDGVWTLATTYLRRNGPLVQHAFKLGSDSDNESARSAVRNSLFMTGLEALKDDKS